MLTCNQHANKTIFGVDLLMYKVTWSAIMKFKVLLDQIEHWNKFVYMCCNLSLGLAIKARAYKGVGQKEAREPHLMLPVV
jgi:hypothetical protein